MPVMSDITCSAHLCSDCCYAFFESEKYEGLCECEWVCVCIPKQENVEKQERGKLIQLQKLTLL